jgi:Arc/MetJ-type ribon-helix-helix transcriptional regulator
MPSVSPADILNTVVESLVKKEKYASAEEALREIAISAVRSKINYYQRRIRKLERKYATDFDTFTARLEGRATPAQEDDWLEWRSARRMLADWQQTYRDLHSDAAR